jgi:hypothetical protein
MTTICRQTTLLGRLLPGLAAGLAFIAFLPALRATFVNWDDEASFLTNTALDPAYAAELGR